MNIAVVHQAESISHTDMYYMFGAVRLQMRDHVTKSWGLVPPLMRLFKSVDQVPSEWMIVSVLDDADQAGVLGYHDETPDGRPYGRVFAKTTLSYGGTALSGQYSVASVLSHEVAELLGDPSCAAWSDRGDGKAVATELCDLVQAFCYDVHYDGHDVSVSDFVLPAGFDPQGKAPYDWLHKMQRPFQVTPGGYTIIRSVGSEGQQSAEKAPDFEFYEPDLPPEWQKEVKWVPASRTVRRLSERG